MTEGPKGEQWETRTVHPGKVVRLFRQFWTSPNIPDKWIGERIAVWMNEKGEAFAGDYRKGMWYERCRVIKPIIQLQKMETNCMNLEEAGYLKDLAGRIERLEKQNEPGQIAKAFEYFKKVFHQTEKTREVVLDLKQSRQLHAAMGLAGEAGEVLELFKKQFFGYNYKGINRADLVKELGDLTWYFYLMLDSSGITIDEVLKTNADKLSERYKDRVEQ